MAKFKFAKALSHHYAENSQVNPIRWEIFYLEDDGINMTPQTAPFKCKDFFNDFVCKIHTGVSFTIYYMDTSTIKLNADGVWCRVKHIGDLARFIANVNATVNQHLPEEEHIKVSKRTKDSCLIYFPNSVFSSTYKISLITWLIRVSNFTYVFENMDAALDNLPLRDVDCPFNSFTRDKLKAWKFTLPEQYQKFWFFANNAYNSETITAEPELKLASHTIHNNGVGGFTYSMAY